LGLDDDLTTSTDGIEVKQTVNQSDVIDFDTVRINIYFLVIKSFIFIYLGSRN
jgi:hypothetical protein